MLLGLLPGFRDLRTSLVTGYLWLFFLWLVIDLPERAELSGPTARAVELGDHLSAAGLIAVASFVAFFVGSVYEDVIRLPLDVIAGRPLSISNDPEEMVARARKQAELSEQAKQELARLEERVDQLISEAQLRLAIVFPLAAMAIYMGFAQSPEWFFGLAVVPVFALQARARLRSAGISQANTERWQ
jgi:hypothetical protein